VTVDGAPDRMTITRYSHDNAKPIEVAIGTRFMFAVRADDLAEAWAWLMNGVGLPPAGAGQPPSEPAMEPTEPVPEPAPTEPQPTP